MIKIAGVKSNDKINFREFVDFFNKVDWVVVVGFNNVYIMNNINLTMNKFILNDVCNKYYKNDAKFQEHFRM